MNKIFKNPRYLTFLGLMLGLTVILDSTPLGAIPLGPVSATITHIPTIITGIILGPVAGIISGTFLGLVSLIHAATRPASLLDPLFINPLVSVLPRMFIGFVSYYVFAFFSRIIRERHVKQTVSTFIGGMAGSLTNTGLVFLMLYLVYAQEVAQRMGVAFKVILISVFTTNAIAEAIVSGILTLVISTAYFRYIAGRNGSAKL